MQLLSNLVDALNANAGAIQAIATVFLVIITWTYVRHTASLAKTSERQADTIVKQYQREKDDRRLLVQKNLFVELQAAKRIVDQCNSKNVGGSVVETYVWDNLRVDLGYFTSDLSTTVAH